MQRFQGHPITIELLTRYKTGSEQTALLKKLEAGSVDLVIGTHKLFNKKIKSRISVCSSWTRNSGSASGTRKRSRK